MKKRMAALLCSGMVLFSQVGFTRATLAQSVPLTPSQVIDASNYTSTGDLQIDNGQNVVVDFTNAPNGLQITGNLINQGNLYAISTSSQQNTANFFAQNIVNAQSALFTTVLPTAGIAGFSNAIPNLNLSLTATNNIVNQSVLTSAGDLNLSANLIINALPTGATGTAPVMQAVNNLNISALVGTINSGVMSSVASNINIASVLNNVVFENISGQLSALQGTINVRDCLYTGSGGTLFVGGQVLSEQFNIWSGTGTIQLHPDLVSGELNTFADTVHVSVTEGELRMGSLIAEDPSIYNTKGDISINSPLVFSGKHLAIVASGNIFASKGASIIDTSSSTVGGEVTIVAGAFIGCCPKSGYSPTPLGYPIHGPETLLTQYEGYNGSFDDSGFIVDGWNGNETTLDLGNIAINTSGKNAGNVTLVNFGGGIRALGPVVANSS